MKKTTSKTSGFTLIELMVSVIIVGIMFGIIVTSMTGLRKSSRDAQRQTDLRSIQSALQNFYADQNYFPTTLTLSSSTSITGGGKTYLANTPTDPTGATAYIYRSGLDSSTGKNT